MLTRVPTASVPLVNSMVSVTLEAAFLTGTSSYEIHARITNTSGTPIRNPFVEVVELTRGNILMPPDLFESGLLEWEDLPGGAGATVRMLDELFAPGDTTELIFKLQLASRRSFRFVIDVRGDPVP